MALRLAFRSAQAASAWTSGRWKAVIAASVLDDVATAAVLRRSTRALTAPRLVVDGIETAIWSQHPSANVEVAVQSNLPLAIEAGLRYGAAGLVVPLSSAVFTNALNLLRHKPVVLAPFRWLVIGVLFGKGLAMIETRHLDTVLERFDHERQARIRQAELAGQNEVAMGADSIVDDLCRISPMIGDEASHSAIGPMIHAWKAELATKTQVGAVYLGTALVEWERHYNSLHPELARDLWFEVHRGGGTHIVTARQVRWLWDTLDRLERVGTVVVAVEHTAETHWPGMALVLSLGGEPVVIPADPAMGLPPLDIGPLVFALGALHVLDTATKHNAHCAPAAIVPISAACLVASVWSQRQVVAKGDASHAPILAVASAVALCHAMASSETIRQPITIDGHQRLPFLSGILVLAMMLTLYWRDLTGAQRAGVISALVLSMGVGAVLYPERVSVADLGRELLWVGAASWSTAKLRRSLDASAAELTESLEIQCADEERRAFGDGRSVVLALVAQACSSLRSQLGDASQMDPRLRREAQRRLDEVDAQLAAMAQ